jgi:transcriptional regulator with XRE-family HTH domain
MVNVVNRVRGAIYERFRSESALASHLGWSRGKLTSYTSGRVQPKIDDIQRLAEALGKDPGEMLVLFLDLKSQIRDQKNLESGSQRSDS